MPRYVVESCAAGSVVREQRERARLAAELGTGIRYVLGVNKSVSLLGAGAAQTTISGGGPVVEVASSVSVAMDGLKITGGSSLVDGGGIRNLGTLVVTNAIVSGNTTTTTGGGIVNGTAETPGTLTLSSSTVQNNSAGGTIGGGIYNDGALTLTQSVVTKNSAGVDGGGIYNNGGTVTLNNSKVIKNTPNDCVGC